MYTEKTKIGIKDIDKNLEILNKSILEILENVAVYHADAKNRGPHTTYEEGFAWVLSDWKVKVLKRPIYGEELIVKTWRRDSKRFFTYRDYEMTNSKGEVQVIATSKWAMFSFKEGKVIRIDDEMEKWNEPQEEKSVFKNRKIEKIQLPEEYEISQEYTVMRKDIDINGHMHNINYLDLAYEIMPQDVFENCNFDNIHIDYKKEIKFGDVVICNYAKIDNKIIVEVVNKQDGTVHAVIEMK